VTTRDDIMLDQENQVNRVLLISTLQCLLLLYVIFVKCCDMPNRPRIMSSPVLWGKVKKKLYYSCNIAKLIKIHMYVALLIIMICYTQNGVGSMLTIRRPNLRPYCLSVSTFPFLNLLYTKWYCCVWTHTIKCSPRVGT